MNKTRSQKSEDTEPLKVTKKKKINWVDIGKSQDYSLKDTAL